MFPSNLSQRVYGNSMVPEASRTKQQNTKKNHGFRRGSFVLALPIFPGRLQPSIVGRSELNFRVRDGNGWTLALISTNCQHSSIPSCRLMCNCLHPENRTMYRSVWRRLRLPAQIVGQALGLLVPVSCIHYCTSTSGLSTRSSLWALTPYWMRDLILGRVSRLDAFSVYLVQT